MADEKQLAILQQGTRAWNEWRATHENAKINLSTAVLEGANLANADLAQADLGAAHLEGANLTGADLTGATLLLARMSKAILSKASMRRANLMAARLDGARMNETYLAEANLSSATLTDADLTEARLWDANLNGADLQRANLTRAQLTRTNLSYANMAQANLSDALLISTLFVGADLSAAAGLETCTHRGPSGLDFDTLLKSGRLPLTFLRGCGMPDAVTEYLPSLLNIGPIQFYSCFISYSTANQDFADRLHADLQAKGVRCWFAPHDMSPGKKIHEQIDEAIRVYDRLLLILSKESMSSSWVKTEIGKARKKEVSSARRVLFPISLVPFDEIRAWEQFDADRGEDIAREIREYFVPDFSAWQTNHDAYQRGFEKVVTALKSADDQLPA